MEFDETMSFEATCKYKRDINKCINYQTKEEKKENVSIFVECEYMVPLK